jgi:hypothetical protein
MIDSVEDLNQLPILLLLYPSGSSGEFLAYALSESFPAITDADQHWENHSRCKYTDLFNRQLNSGLREINNNDVVAGVNSFLSKNDLSEIHVGLLHPKKPSVDFVKKYLPHAPIIEIVTHQLKSKKFRHTASFGKIPHYNDSDVERYNKEWDTHYGLYNQCHYNGERHLRIEWEDILLTRVSEMFNLIEQFVGKRGDIDKFKSMIDDYLLRNQEIFKLIENI